MKRGSSLQIPIVYVLAIFFAYALLVYEQVFVGQYFFWEDFFIFEYPVRQFSFYMLGIKHLLPFWNPYSWAWEPFIADAQSGIWYPLHFLQIPLTSLFLPNGVQLPVMIPEIFTILQMCLASLGVFVLLKSEFQVRDLVALLSGIAFGFGARMVADQNHEIFVTQLSLLPWETLILIRSWNSWKYSIGLGLLFGTSFLVGHQQVFLFIAIFLSFFTLWELWNQRNFRVLFNCVLALVITTGIAAIQLLPLLSLTHSSFREHLSFPDASMGSMHPFRFISFVVPKFFGEFPSYIIPATFADRANEMWYWEGTFYWGVLAEILALFGIIRLWKQRSSPEPRARYIGFFIAFSIFAILFAMGSYGGIQWLFWKFVPIFDHIRMPNRMMWFVWFLGTLATAFGLEELLHHPALLQQYKRYFYSCSAVFIFINILAISQAFQPFIRPHIYPQVPQVILHSLVASLLVLLFFFVFINRLLPVRWLLPCAAVLMILDLYYVDITWHRNTLNRETLIAWDSISTPILDFKRMHGSDHSKLLMLDSPMTRQKELNLGMFLRLPIEFSDDSDGLLGDNPMRLVNIFPPVADSIRRMEIMGVSMTVYPDGHEFRDSLALPFVKLYHSWIVSPTRNEASKTLNDSSFDFRSTIILESAPRFQNITANGLTDSIYLSSYSENQIAVRVWSSKPSILLVNDLYYPAWRATLDGKPIQIIRAFCSLRAVEVPPGNHQIEMYYDSYLFDLGWKITVGTLIISVLLLVLIPKNISRDSEILS